MDNELLYNIALSFDESLTPIEKKALLLKYESSENILKLSKNLLKNILGRRWTGTRYKTDYFISCANKILPFINKSGIKILRFDDPAYPEGLKEIPDHPYLIYYRGNINYELKKSIAIVGTRKPDESGYKKTKLFTGFLCKNDFTIISGLADGIDTFAHKICLENNGKTIAVLGCGIDQIYPAVNKLVGKKIIESGGGIISEYPPGFQPKKWYFPRRNRIIVGLSRSVFIIQSPERSGSLISASLAADYNRDLFVASPDNIKNEKYSGNLFLIGCGAKEIISPEDFQNVFEY